MPPVLRCLLLQAVQSAEQRERQAAAARAVALLEAKAAKLCEMLSSVLEDTKVRWGAAIGHQSDAPCCRTTSPPPTGLCWLRQL